MFCCETGNYRTSRLIRVPETERGSRGQDNEEFLFAALCWLEFLRSLRELSQAFGGTALFLGKICTLQRTNNLHLAVFVTKWGL